MKTLIHEVATMVSIRKRTTIEFCIINSEPKGRFEKRPFFVDTGNLLFLIVFSKILIVCN